MGVVVAVAVIAGVAVAWRDDSGGGRRSGQHGVGVAVAVVVGVVVTVTLGVRSTWRSDRPSGSVRARGHGHGRDEGGGRRRVTPAVGVLVAVASARWSPVAVTVRRPVACTVWRAVDRGLGQRRAACRHRRHGRGRRRRRKAPVTVAVGPAGSVAVAVTATMPVTVAVARVVVRWASPCGRRRGRVGERVGVGVGARRGDCSRRCSTHRPPRTLVADLAGLPNAVPADGQFAKGPFVTALSTRAGLNVTPLPRPGSRRGGEWW
jgi:hypothetical protein